MALEALSRPANFYMAWRMTENQINNTDVKSTVDDYFVNRQIPYDAQTRLGDTVHLLPDTFVAKGNPFEETALGVTPIYVILSGGASSKENVPKGAFWMQLPSGACLYGKNWKSGETTYG